MHLELAVPNVQCWVLVTDCSELDVLGLIRSLEGPFGGTIKAIRDVFDIICKPGSLELVYNRALRKIISHGFAKVLPSKYARARSVTKIEPCKRPIGDISVIEMRRPLSVAHILWLQSLGIAQHLKIPSKR